jgi:hypothetical protein
MLLLDVDKKVDLREFLSTLQNGTHENAVVFKDEGVPVAADPSVTLRHYAELFPSDFASTAKNMDKVFSESHVRNLFGKNEKQLISIQAGLENNDFPEENESGPCRDRTDDPQIKSVSEEDDSKPD